MKITIKKIGTCILSSKTKNRLKHEIHRNIGKNVCTLHKFPIENNDNPGLNRCNIYTEVQGYDPKEMFKDIVTWGTNYLFGMFEIRHTRQKVFFLVDIEEPLHISEGNRIICPEKEREIIINVK